MHKQCAVCDFNSRPSARGDVIKNLEDAIASIFQFTPLREGRPDLVETQNVVDVFQFTPLREGRPALICTR